ncbi:MAG: cohesin domain-containing protein, partial [Candidatus Gastranaerophilaceae bacterium]
DTISVPVKIDNNHGIMGYRITVKFNPQELEIISVENSTDFLGTFNDSIGIKTGEFDVLWNSTSEVIKDATLFTLNFNVITTTNTTSKIELSYTQADTFNEEYKDVVFDCQDINISLNAECEHDYVSEITKAPTCKETGIRTYTCSKCGDTYTEAIEKVPHSYSEWTYNGDAKYNSSSSYTNGTQSRTCTVCGETETVEAPNTALLRRRGNALALESSITLTTYITKDIVDYYDEVYAEFARNDKTENVYASEKTFTSGSTVYNVFDYKGISPQAMGDDIEITFYGIKDGVKYWGETYTYSVTTYVQSTLSKSTTSSKLKTMLVDLMYYGAACQTYSNYKTDALMTDILTDEQKQLKSNYALELSNIKNSSYETCENRLVRFGTALRLNNAVEIALPLNMTNVTLDELTLKVKIGTRELTYTYAENPENFEKGLDGYWYFYFDGVYANQMSDEVFISAYRGSEQVSYTLKYSVESYAATVTDSNLKAATDAMMYYGNSAKAYAGN